MEELELRRRRQGESQDPRVNRVALDRQREHWDRTFAGHPAMFGVEPSDPARAAAELFLAERRVDLLELGAGQGRDTLFFARKGLRVRTLDYSEQAVEAVRARADGAGLSEFISASRCDLREPLPFADESFDACYSHMLFCMALTTRELQRLSVEVGRVLRPGGLCVYTVRTTADVHYGAGIDRGDDMYEVGDFIVHFFSRSLVEQLSAGYELLDVAEFEEGTLPRRLFRVTMRKV